MFALFIMAVFATIGFIVWTIIEIINDESKIRKLFSICASIICLIAAIALSQTAQTKMYWINFIVGTKTGTWIVIDNSGGKTMRHWILLNNYVKACDQTDGWEFFAESCSPCKVGGDAFVGKITEEQAKGDYKKQFNIPEDQITLH